MIHQVPSERLSPRRPRLHLSNIAISTLPQRILRPGTRAWRLYRPRNIRRTTPTNTRTRITRQQDPPRRPRRRVPALQHCLLHLQRRHHPRLLPEKEPLAHRTSTSVARARQACRDRYSGRKSRPACLLGSRFSRSVSRAGPRRC
jgi:hypothetical protein